MGQLRWEEQVVDAATLERAVASSRSGWVESIPVSMTPTIIEQNRDIDEVTLKKYLPDTENMLPMVTGGSNFVDTKSFNTEREILYQILFDMRKDITDLKALVNNIMSGNINVITYKDKLKRVSFSKKSTDGVSSSRGLASSSRAGPCPGVFTDSKRVSGKVCSMKARNSMHRVISSVMMCRSWSLSIPAPTGWPLCAPTMIRSPNVDYEIGRASCRERV